MASEAVRYDEDTLFKANEALKRSGLNETQTLDAMTELLNAGIVFRERA